MPARWATWALAEQLAPTRSSSRIRGRPQRLSLPSLLTWRARRLRAWLVAWGAVLCAAIGA
eukprot:8411529-Alexandrium_andersonii.AAC.1